MIALVERGDAALDGMELLLGLLIQRVEFQTHLSSGGGRQRLAVEELGCAISSVAPGCSNDGLGVGVQCQLQLAALVLGHAAEKVGDGVVVKAFLVPILLLCFSSNRLHRCIEGGEKVGKSGRSVLDFAGSWRLRCVFTAACNITQALIGCADSIGRVDGLHEALC